MQSFLVVVNDIRNRESVTVGMDIVKFLVSRGVWIFPNYAPIKRFRSGDRLVIYVGGKIKAFVAEARIASLPAPLESPLLSTVHQMGLRWFHWSVRITEPRYLHPPREIKTLLSELRFVKDKKNYGLALRQGVRRLEERDAATILSAT